MICHLMNHQSNFYQLLLKECYDRGPWGGPWEQTCVRKMPHIHRTGTWGAPCHWSPPHEIPYASEQHKGMKRAGCIPYRSRASCGCSCDPTAGSMCWTSSGRRDTWTRVLNWCAILASKGSDESHIQQNFLNLNSKWNRNKFNYRRIRNTINWQRTNEGNIRHMC